jgi:hypothetical protein
MKIRFEAPAGVRFEWDPKTRTLDAVPTFYAGSRQAREVAHVSVVSDAGGAVPFILGVSPVTGNLTVNRPPQLIQAPFDVKPPEDRSDKASDGDLQELPAD